MAPPTDIHMDMICMFKLTCLTFSVFSPYDGLLQGTSVLQYNNDNIKTSIASKS